MKIEIVMHHDSRATTQRPMPYSLMQVKVAILTAYFFHFYELLKVAPHFHLGLGLNRFGSSLLPNLE